MIIENITHDGVTYTMMTQEELLALQVPMETIQKEIDKINKRKDLHRLRNKLTNTIGDHNSLIGVNADINGLQVAMHAVHVIALADHASNEAQRAELEMLQTLAGDDDIVEISRKIIEGISSGSCILTANLKGVENTINDAMERSTKASQLLVAAKQQSNQ